MKEKFCHYCKTRKPTSEFYQRRGKEGGSSYCKPCTNAETSQRSIAFKEKCVEYKGGKCELCGYNKYIGALEFHHKDPTKKDLQISKVRGRSFNDKIKKELDKCQILCCNCHREMHFIENKKKSYNRK
tara:strand:- start:448 stop:831 length:384 start_codon:yes stop_codon:yes gene_type:complete